MMTETEAQTMALTARNLALMAAPLNHPDLCADRAHRQRRLERIDGRGGRGVVVRR